MTQRRKRLGAIFLSAALAVTQLSTVVMAENGAPGQSVTVGTERVGTKLPGILPSTPSEADMNDMPTYIPTGNPHAITIIGWTFVDDDYLTGGELALPGVNIEHQVDFDTVVSMLPGQIRAETDREIAGEDKKGDVSGQKEVGLETLSIAGWSCLEYIQDDEGDWPLTGEYTFTAKLPDGYACDPLPEVKVILGGISLMTINDRYSVDGLIYKETGPKNVQLIGFAKDNTGFTGTLTIPGEVTVGDKTFAVTSIGNAAFEKSKITGLDLSSAKNMKYIGGKAFRLCANLRSNIVIPKSVTEIKNEAFSDSGIIGLELSEAENLIRIGNYAFSHCRNLEGRLVIPGSVTEIGDRAFTTVDFTGSLALDLSGAENLRRIGSSAFNGRYNLAGELAIPESVSEIGMSAFYNTNILKFIAGNNTVANLLAECGVDRKKIELPGGTEPVFPDSPAATSFYMEHLEYTVTGADTVALTGRAPGTNFTKVTIPANVTDTDDTYRVTEIGASAFRSTSITELDFNQADHYHLKRIGESAFDGCKDLRKIIIPESVTEIGDFAFYETGITELDLSEADNLKSIGKGVFGYCNELSGSITIPKAVTRVGDVAFWESNQIKEVVIQGRLQTLGRDAFPSGSSIHCADPATQLLVNEVLNLDKIPDASWNGRDDITAGAVVTVDKDVHVTSNVTIESGAEVTVSSGGRITIETGGTITIETGGTITIETGGMISIESGAEVTGAGTIAVKNGGTLRGTPNEGVTVEKLHHVTVVNGTGAGDYPEGATVKISAAVPDGKVFVGWTADSEDVIFDDSGSADTSFTMPGYPVEVTAAFEDSVPVITVQPQDITVTAGAAGDFTVAAADTASNTLFFQWQVNAGRGWTDVTDGSGGDTDRYTTPAASVAMNGWSYRCVITGGSSVTTRAAVLTVEDGIKTVAVTGVRLDKDAHSLYVGQKVTLTATVLPEDATDKSVIFTSGNTGVATVAADGAVTAHAIGTAVITVTTNDGNKTDTCLITVGETPSGDGDSPDEGGDSPDEGGDSSGGGGSSGRGSSRTYTNPDALRGSWIQTDTGVWMFRQTSGVYAKSRWGIVDGLWYYFDSEGRMLIGWQLLGNRWYYLCTEETAKTRAGMKEGAMVSGWHYDSMYQKWFYFDESGAMATGWREIDGKWYYFNPVSDGTRGVMKADRLIDGWYVAQNGIWDGKMSLTENLN